MTRHTAELRARHATCVVVSFGSVEQVAAYSREVALPIPVGADPQRLAYAAYGLGRASARNLWHPRVWLRYAALIARGRRPHRAAPGDDLAQLGGDFVIDASGRLRFAHVSQRPDDRPSIKAILRALSPE